MHVYTKVLIYMYLSHIDIDHILLNLSIVVLWVQMYNSLYAPQWKEP